jgi:hypothetical protein
MLVACLLAGPGVLPGSSPEEFLLKVILIDPAATTELQTRIVPRKPFELSEMHHSAKITIKGELAVEQKGSYHLRIAIVEWASEKSNSTENYEVDLVPGKAQNRGFISSFVFQRIILLTRVPAGEQ